MIYRCAYTYRSSTDFTPQLEAHQRLVRCARLNCRLKHLLLQYTRSKQKPAAD
jgi:hypothetical protein